MAKIDVTDAFCNKQESLDFVLPGLLRGTVGAIVAPGSTGKSFFAAELAIEIALQPEHGSLLGMGAAKGQVLYIAAEDPEPILKHRLHSIGKQLTQEARERLHETLVVECVVGEPFDIMQALPAPENTFTRQKGKNALKQLQELVTVLDQKIKESNLKDLRLIFIDTLARVHTKDENKNNEMSQVIKELERIAVKYNCAIVFLHHVSKSSARESDNSQQSARGASAIIDNARWCAFLRRYTKEEFIKDFGFTEDQAEFYAKNGRFLEFGVNKQNYSAPIEPAVLERGEGGVMHFCSAQEVEALSCADNFGRSKKTGAFSSSSTTQQYSERKGREPIKSSAATSKKRAATRTCW